MVTFKIPWGLKNDNTIVTCHVATSIDLQALNLSTYGKAAPASCEYNMNNVIQHVHGDVQDTLGPQ